MRDVVESEDGEDPIGCRRSSRSRSRARRPASCAAGPRALRAARRARHHAREVERAWSSTIDGFCLRVLRSHAVARGPRSLVRACSTTPRPRELAGLAFADALEDWLGPPEKPSAGALRGCWPPTATTGCTRRSVRSTTSLRNARPRSPAIPPAAPGRPGRGARALEQAASAALAGAEHGRARSGKRAVEALELLAECLETLAGAGEPQPVEGSVRGDRRNRAPRSRRRRWEQSSARRSATYAKVLEDELGAPLLALVGELLRGLRRRRSHERKSGRERARLRPTSRCARAPCCAGTPGWRPATARGCGA